VNEKKFTYLETWNLNQDALENTFGAIRLHCRSNNNPTVGQFVDALRTVFTVHWRIQAVSTYKYHYIVLEY
jgi:hypothetical protein